MRKIYEVPTSAPGTVQVSFLLVEYDLFAELGENKRVEFYSVMDSRLLLLKQGVVFKTYHGE